MQGTGWAGGRAGGHWWRRSRASCGTSSGANSRRSMVWARVDLRAVFSSTCEPRPVSAHPTFQLSSCQPAPRGPACGRAPHTVLHPGRSRGKTLATWHSDASQIVTPAAEAAHTARMPLHGRRRPGPTSRVAKFRADLIADGHVHYLCTLLWTQQIRLVTPTKRKEIR